MKIKLLLVTLLITLTVIAATYADIPNMINFQGKATDKQGVPLNGDCNITFRIYEGETGETPLWIETHEDVAIVNGIFQVLLGSVTPLDLSFDENYWISVEVNSDGEMSPTTRFASVGYAYKAKKAEEVTKLTLPFYRSGFDVQYIDTADLIVAPGCIDIGGTLLTVADKSPIMAVDDPDNYIEGAVPALDYWAYVYVYNNGGSVGYKFSTNSPNKADHSGNEAGIKRYYTPDGAAYYRCIGWFYKNTSGNVIEFGNLREADVVNVVKAVGASNESTTSRSYVDMPDMTVNFISSGRPVKILFQATLSGHQQAESSHYQLMVDGVEKITGGFNVNDASYSSVHSASLPWVEILPAGPHTIKIRWKVGGGRLYQSGITYGERILIAEEL